MPAPQAPQSLNDLEFEPQPMVCWFSPIELAKAAIKSVVSSIFGEYADKRELDAALTPMEEPADYSAKSASEDGLWLDYIADLGDGWDSTYTMARLLAKEGLSVNGADTQRGHVLIMGGDQVYPTAKLEEYNNRLIHPYRCALPYVEEEDKVPHLYAVPGNHDWYDGLTNFRHLFMQKHWIGGWKTQQQRSYFAFKLAPDWWLWGIDIQLNSNIDKPQMDFFRGLAADEQKMAPNSKVILCTAEPSWVLYDMLGESYYDNLNYLERKALLPHGHHIAVALAGDLHNYTRYQHEDGSTQRFVAGGGGAYLFPTHNMPKELKLPRVKAEQKHKSAHSKERYQQADSFPNHKDSVGLTLNSLLFPFKNISFTLFLSSFYLLITWLLQSNSVKKLSEQFSFQDYLTVLKEKDYSATYHYFLEIISHSPSIIILLGILIGGLIAFVESKQVSLKIILGSLHGMAHVALLILLGKILIQLHSFWHPLLFALEILLIGGLVGGLLFGFYLFLSNILLGIHANEVLLCQSNPHYKNFLRLHLTQEKLVIYPIGVKRVPTAPFNPFARSVAARLSAWVLQKDAAAGEAWFEPKGDKNIEDYAQLIEAKPIEINFSELDK